MRENSFLCEREAYKEEFDAFYSTFPVNVDDILCKLALLADAHPGASSMKLKGLGYGVLAKECSVKVFRHCPFYFAVPTGIRRSRIGGKLPLEKSGFSSWVMQRNAKINEAFCRMYDPYENVGLIHYIDRFWDNVHQIAGYDTVLKLGLSGVKEKAERRMQGEHDPDVLEYLTSTVQAMDALMLLSERFGKAAETMAAEERDPLIRERLERIASTAPRVPRHAPQTFYEGLNTLLFIHDAFVNFDCCGICSQGHIDQSLEMLYNADVEAGRLTRQDAKELLRWFLSITDTRADYTDKSRDHLNQNMALTIGGVHRDGTPIYNDITRMVLEVMEELSLVNPNLAIRISSHHPKAYLEQVASFIADGTNSSSLFIDETIIEANVRRGKTLQDSRDYTVGGCQETVLNNCEHYGRAQMYLNLPMLLNMTLLGRQEDKALLAGDFPLMDAAQAQSFSDVYEAFFSNLKAFCDSTAENYNRYEPYAAVFNPMPMYSSLLDDCIEKGKDSTQGGARYNPACISLVGIGTVINVLYAIKTEVFEKGMFTLSRLRSLLESDFEGREGERARQYLLNRVSKYGDDAQEVNLFAAKVFADTAKVSTGQKNTMGGTYDSSIYSYHWYRLMGEKTMATFDGRKAGMPLSRGAGGGEYSTTIEVSKAIHSMHLIDQSIFPGVCILYLDMPFARRKLEAGVFVDLIRYFAKNGGYCLQLNVVDRSQLIDAQKHPERYGGLVVRVCGYSEYFTCLDKKRQDEMILRNEAMPL